MAVIGVIGGLLGMITLPGSLNAVFVRLLPSPSFQISLTLLFVFVFSGALFNQLTFHIAYWRRNFLHKRGNRVKVSFQLY